MNSHRIELIEHYRTRVGAANKELTKKELFIDALVKKLI